MDRHQIVKVRFEFQEAEAPDELEQPEAEHSTEDNGKLNTGS